jgi:hypothetical protein
LKKQKLHIRFAWVLLLCFIAGQTMVYSHQHHARVGLSTGHVTKSPQAGQTLSEKCNLCDMMHHTHMAIFNDTPISPVVTVLYKHYNRQHDYVGIALILSAGRSPPTV